MFFANQGEFRSGNYFEMMNKASCLSLLSNAVLVYNTVHIGEFLAQAETNSSSFSPDTIAHVSPLQHGHVIVNGTYDFSGTRQTRVWAITRAYPTSIERSPKTHFNPSYSESQFQEIVSRSQQPQKGTSRGLGLRL